MAIIITSNNGKIHYGVKHFICDTADDVQYLPVDEVWPGSTAYVISTYETYMFNGHKEWIKISTGGGGGGGSGTAATIQVGEVVTGQSGSEVTIQNSGTESAAVFDFSIPRGEPFQIKKVYNSIESMNADYNNPNIHIGDLVCIVTDPEDPDNASLYVKGDTQYEFFVDMSGATGIQGATGAKGAKGDKGDPFVYEDFTPEQLASLVGPTGVGIESVVLNNDYTLTFTYTDGETYTTGSVRGPKGDAFTYEDFTPEQLAALTGPQGPEGPAGADGAQGPAGADGKDGEDGAQGPQGIQGNAGPSGVGIASVTQGEQDNTVRITLSNGTYYEVELDTIQGPQGEKGDTFTYSDLTPAQIASLKGAKGDTGAQGNAGTITIGTVTTGATPAVENVGTAQNAILNITLPAGSAYNIFNTYSSTADAETDIANIPDNSMVIIAGSGSDNGDVLINKDGTLVYVTNLTGAQGIQGPQGEAGAAATITVGTVTTGAVPSVTNSGTSSAVVLDFVLPAATLEGITLPTAQEWEEGDTIVITDPDGEISKLDIDKVGEEIIKNTADPDLTTGNKTIEGAINELDDVKVPETREIAGVDLADDISVSELREALGIVVGEGRTITVGGLAVYKQNQTPYEINSKTLIPELTGKIQFHIGGATVYGCLTVVANGNNVTVSDTSSGTNKDALVIEGDFSLLPAPAASVTYDEKQFSIGPCYEGTGGIANFRLVTNNDVTAVEQIHGWIHGTIGPKRVDNIFLNRPFEYTTNEFEVAGGCYEHHNLEVTGYLKLNNNEVNNTNVAFGKKNIIESPSDGGTNLVIGTENVINGANGCFTTGYSNYTKNGNATFINGCNNAGGGSNGVIIGGYDCTNFNFANLATILGKSPSRTNGGSVGTNRYGSAYQKNNTAPLQLYGTLSTYNYINPDKIIICENVYFKTSEALDTITSAYSKYTGVTQLYTDAECTQAIANTGSKGYNLVKVTGYVYDENGQQKTYNPTSYYNFKNSSNVACWIIEGVVFGGSSYQTFTYGGSNTNIGPSSGVFGYSCTANGEGNLVAGKYVTAAGRAPGVTGFGYQNHVEGQGSLVAGSFNLNEGVNGFATGYQTYLSGEGGIVGGKFNVGSGESIVSGNANFCYTLDNIMCGYNNRVRGGQGHQTVNGDYNTIKTGSDNLVVGYNNWVEYGYGIIVYGSNNYTCTNNENIYPGEVAATSKQAQFNIVGGRYNKVANVDSAVFGQNNTSIGPDSLTFGQGNYNGKVTNGVYNEVPNDVTKVQAYYNPIDGYFYEDNEFTTKVTPDTSTIYICKLDNDNRTDLGDTIYRKKGFDSKFPYKYDNVNDTFYAVTKWGSNATTDIMVPDTGTLTTVFGSNNRAFANLGLVAGINNCVDSGSYLATVFGENNTVIQGSINNVVVGKGNNLSQSASYCHVEGLNNTLMGGAIKHHVEGEGNTASSGTYNCHIEGAGNYVNGGVNRVHIEGINSSVNGGTCQGAHVEGEGHNFSGTSIQNSHIEGVGHTKSGGSLYAAHIGGRYADLSDANILEAIGNGGAPTEEGGVITRHDHNARTLDFGGNETLSGNLTIGGTPTQNTHAATVGMLKTLLLNFADEYDEDETYMQGYAVVYNWGFYICNDDNVTGVFDDTKWTKTTVTKYVRTLIP